MRVSSIVGLMCLIAATTLCTASQYQPPVSGEHPMTEGMTPRIDHTISYSLVYDSKMQLIFLTGTLQIGIVRALKKILADYPETSGLVLDSEGGNIFQARGIAIIIQDKSLDTYVQYNCYSACVLAYVAGDKRFLFATAKLGFHAYRLESSPLGSFINLDAEQNKDLAFYTKQIPDTEFVSKIFHQNPSEIWSPSTGELINAGVAHSMLTEDWQID